MYLRCSVFEIRPITSYAECKLVLHMHLLCIVWVSVCVNLGDWLQVAQRCSVLDIRPITSYAVKEGVAYIHIYGYLRCRYFKEVNATASKVLWFGHLANPL